MCTARRRGRVLLRATAGPVTGLPRGACARAAPRFGSPAASWRAAWCTLGSSSSCRCASSPSEEGVALRHQRRRFRPLALISWAAPSPARRHARRLRCGMSRGAGRGGGRTHQVGAGRLPPPCLVCSWHAARPGAAAAMESRPFNKFTPCLCCRLRISGSSLERRGRRPGWRDLGVRADHAASILHADSELIPGRLSPAVPCLWPLWLAVLVSTTVGVGADSAAMPAYRCRSTQMQQVLLSFNGGLSARRSSSRRKGLRSQELPAARSVAVRRRKAMPPARRGWRRRPPPRGGHGKGLRTPFFFHASQCSCP